MKFEEWWVTISPVERRIIGANTGKFIWDQAYKAAREALEKELKEKEIADRRQ
jgi:3-oxoacyl-[acyl-carrier-protein] synthase III